jgi:hypothetical protein
MRRIAIASVALALTSACATLPELTVVPDEGGAATEGGGATTMPDATAPDVGSNADGFAGATDSVRPALDGASPDTVQRDQFAADTANGADSAACSVSAINMCCGTVGCIDKGHPCQANCQTCEMNCTGANKICCSTGPSTVSCVPLPEDC